MKNIFYTLFALALIGGGIYLGIWTMKHIGVNWVPFIAAGFGFLVSRIYEAYKENRARLYEKKREVYANLLRPYQSILINSLLNKNDGTDRPTELTTEMLQLAAISAFDAIFYASDEVVRTYGLFRNVSQTGEATSERILGTLSRLLKAIRKDLGHTWTSLSDGEILAMFINLSNEEQMKYKDLSKYT